MLRDEEGQVNGYICELNPVAHSRTKNKSDRRAIEAEIRDPITLEHETSLWPELR